MFNIGDILWQLFYIALLVLLFVMVVKAVHFFIKHMTKINNLESKRDELHDRLKKRMNDCPFFWSLGQEWALNGFGQLYQWTFIRF
ncbi:hypothetical protein [Peribacillus simplex]|uniref:hypothetical protein n=1 Tax=Peribacillus simplex TaxID=1478 RepID=UPI0024C06759|nr:hypothetical protein [Peribacillus simplex]WHY96366.1 hypothetical protein QNH37_20625 [Peribacillus simplex]